MDYSYIIRQLQVLINDNKISFIPLGLILINIIIYIVSKTFRKTGLFVLALAFLVDYAIKSMPFDLYLTYPNLYNAVTVLYILGFILFFLKVLKMVIRVNRSPIATKTNSKFRQFMNFTGMGPFLIMLIVNIIDLNGNLPKNIITAITSITFLYIMIKTVYSTYNFLRSKESILLDEKLDFKEFRDFLNEDTPKSKTNSKNQGRIIRKTLDKEPVIDHTEVIKKDSVKKANKEAHVKVPQVRVDESDKKISKAINDEQKTVKALSNTDLIKVITSDKKDRSNITTITITNLKTNEKLTFTSTRPSLNITEHNEYKIDLEFENINEYDYGRFIDIMLAYSKNKDLYKFELEIAPEDRPHNKVIFYDPSNIYDIDDKDYANVAGSTISMNFPRYKINFISGN